MHAHSTILVTRPPLQAAATGARLTALGYTPLYAPLHCIVPVPVTLPAQAPQAVLLTSANAVPALEGLELPRNTPVYAVGDVTAAQAAAAGFINTHSAGADAVALLALVRARLVPAQGPLLYLRARDVAADVAGQLQTHGFVVHEQVAYFAEPLAGLPHDVQTALEQGQVAAALLYSARSAQQATHLIKNRAPLDLYCLSPNVARMAGAGWRSVNIAHNPDENSLLQLLPKV